MCKLYSITLNVEELNRPHQSGIFLGMQCDYTKGTVALTTSYREKLWAVQKLLSSDQHFSIRSYLHCLGLCIHASRQLRVSLARFAPTIEFFRRAVSDYECVMKLWPTSRVNWKQWVSELLRIDTVQHPCPWRIPNRVLFTDASSGTGWGLVHVAGDQVYVEGRPWTSSGPDRQREICLLELTAILYGLQRCRRGECIILRTDNEAAFYLLKKKLAIEYKINQVLTKIDEVISFRCLHVKVAHIPSASNPADQPSRGKYDLNTTASSLWALGLEATAWVVY